MRVMLNERWSRPTWALKVGYECNARPGPTSSRSKKMNIKIWEYLRGNCLSHCVWDTYEAIVDACCDAWNTLMATPDVIASIGTREWAQVRI